MASLAAVGIESVREDVTRPRFTVIAIDGQHLESPVSLDLQSDDAVTAYVYAPSHDPFAATERSATFHAAALALYEVLTPTLQEAVSNVRRVAFDLGEDGVLHVIEIPA